MKVAIAFVACFAIVTAQSGWAEWIKHYLENLQHEYVLDYIHSYRFEEHARKGQKLLIAVSDSRRDRSCHVIEIDDNLDQYLHSRDSVEKVSEEIYDLIKHQKVNETSLTMKELHDAYHDFSLNRECLNHKKYVLRYKPSFPAPGTPAPTMPAENSTVVD